nr:hypothetical protein [uncultured Kingella sp.]
MSIVKPQRKTSQTQKALTEKPQILIVSIGKNLGSRLEVLFKQQPEISTWQTQNLPKSFS